MFDFHQHFHDHVVIWPEAGTAQGQEFGDATWGLTQIAEPGFVLYRTVGSEGPIPPHRIRNTGSTTNTHIIVELLEPSPKAQPEPWVWNDRGRLEGTDSE
jgi:hypothetical protein